MPKKLCFLNNMSVSTGNRRKKVCNSFWVWVKNSSWQKQKENSNAALHFRNIFLPIIRILFNYNLIWPPFPLPKKKLYLTSNTLLQIYNRSSVPNIGRTYVGYRLQSDLFLCCIDTTFTVISGYFILSCYWIFNSFLSFLLEKLLSF